MGGGYSAALRLTGLRGFRGAVTGVGGGCRARPLGTGLRRHDEVGVMTGVVVVGPRSESGMTGVERVPGLGRHDDKG